MKCQCNWMSCISSGSERPWWRSRRWGDWGRVVSVHGETLLMSWIWGVRQRGTSGDFWVSNLSTWGALYWAGEDEGGKHVRCEADRPYLRACKQEDVDVSWCPVQAHPSGVSPPPPLFSAPMEERYRQFRTQCDWDKLSSR